MMNKEQKPLVSIGLPVYNGEKTISRAIDSLLEQDYKNIEIIISDNASTDNTSKILDEYSSKHYVIKVQTQSEDVGVLNNFQSVLELAKGKYFMWAADDDLWLPGFITQLVKQLESHQDAGVAMCSVKRVKEDGSYFDEVRFLGNDNPNRKSFLGMALGLISPLKYNLYHNGLFRKELLQSAIILRPRIPAADRWLMLQISLASKFRYVDHILHVRTVHEKSFIDRYPDDEYGKKKLLAKNRSVDLEPVPVLTNIILKSRIIPWHRKIFIPIIIYNLIFRRVKPILKRIKKSIYKYLIEHYRKLCPQSLQNAIRRMRQKAL